jgi:hypothetical protein
VSVWGVARLELPPTAWRLQTASSAPLFVRRTPLPAVRTLDGLARMHGPSVHAPRQSACTEPSGCRARPRRAAPSHYSPPCLECTAMQQLTACVGDTHCRTQHAPNERVRSACSAVSDQPISSPPPRHARLRLTPGGCRRIQTCGRGAVACGCSWCVCLLLAVPELDHHWALTTRHAPACVAFHSASCSTCRALARCAEGAAAHRVGHQASLAAASGSSGSRHWCATRPPHARVTQPGSYC